MNIDEKLAEMGIITRTQKGEGGEYKKYREQLLNLKVGEIITVNPAVRQSTNTLASRLGIKVSSRIVLGVLYVYRDE